MPKDWHTNATVCIDDIWRIRGTARSFHSEAQLIQDRVEVVTASWTKAISNVYRIMMVASRGIGRGGITINIVHAHLYGAQVPSRYT